ncbi:hypothetical protein [Gandjariella thermophila]|nr:hypothetical protein [Gandjariella thermophila]
MDNGADSDELGRGRRAAPAGSGGAPHPLTGSPLPPRGRWPAEPAKAASPGAEPAGLCAFNIGLVPASVTPPRTWRQAAWFAVLSSAAVLTGLLLVAALLGSPPPGSRIDALPGYPSVVPTIVPPPGGTPGRPVRDRPVVLAAGTERGAAHGWPDGAREGDPAGPATGPAVPARPGHLPGTPGELPAVSVVAGAGPSIINGETIANETQRFYGSVLDNVRRAYTMTTGALHADGLAALADRYRDVTAMRLESITADPGRGVTTNVLEITRRDGSVRTERRELVFSRGSAPGDGPKISDERPG